MLKLRLGTVPGEDCSAASSSLAEVDFCLPVLLLWFRTAGGSRSLG